MDEKYNALKDLEKDGKEKIPYPKSIYFIITTEFCERFSYYGMRTVLALYFFQILHFTEDNSSVFFHVFNALCYFSPIVGAIIADTFLGKYRTIFYLALLYAAGQIILTLGSVGEEGITGLPAKTLSFLGLFLIAFGTGGIKPCVTTFGGEQFKLPEQNHHMESFFSFFYAAIQAGSLISTIITPMLRNDISCFNKTTCYPSAFALPATLMVIAIVIFELGHLFGFYKLVQPTGNVIFKVFACTWHALVEWIRRRKTEKKDSVFDYAEDKYGKSFVADVKAVFYVLVIYIPFPLCWALNDQQGSRWTFQATRMDGRIGGATILPDQMQAINPFLVMVFIPVFDYGVYPLFQKINLLTTLLQKIVGGAFLAALSFYISGGLEVVLEKTYPIVAPAGHMNLTIYNGLGNRCDMSGFTVLSPNGSPMPIQFFDRHMNSMVKTLNAGETYTIPSNIVTCGGGQLNFPETTFQTNLPENKEDAHGDAALAILISEDFDVKGQGLVTTTKKKIPISKSDTGFPFVKFVWNIKSTDITALRQIKLRHIESTKVETIDLTSETRGDTVIQSVKQIGVYAISLIIENEVVLSLPPVTFKLGGNYLFVIQYSPDSGEYESSVIHEITSPNTIHILWQLPQIFMIAVSEIMFSISALQFAYTQAPESMKSVMMAINFLTIAVGNLINAFIIKLLEGIFTSQAHEFFLFASLMVVDTVILMLITMRYHYVDYGQGTKKPEDETNEDQPIEPNNQEPNK